MRVLLTNDDGIDAAGLRRMATALAELADVELLVIAPDGDRSAVGRGITFRRPVHCEPRVIDDLGTPAWSCDGTPVDCVRLAELGLAGDVRPDLVIAGINQGANLGDDITYSGTVAAALEGVVLGVPAIAVSQRLWPGWSDDGDPFGQAARFIARLVGGLHDHPLPAGTMVNVNVPPGRAAGVEVARLGRRVYYDTLRPEGEIRANGAGRYVLYNAEPGFEDEDGTDVAAIHRGRIALTPLHLDLTSHSAMGALAAARLERLLEEIL